MLLGNASFSLFHSVFVKYLFLLLSSSNIQGTLYPLKNHDTTLSAGELKGEIEKLGLTVKEFKELAKKKGYVNKGEDWWNGLNTDGYLILLQDLKDIQAKKLQAQNKSL